MGDEEVSTLGCSFQILSLGNFICPQVVVLLKQEERKLRIREKRNDEDVVCSNNHNTDNNNSTILQIRYASKVIKYNLFLKSYAKIHQVGQIGPKT